MHSRIEGKRKNNHYMQFIYWKTIFTRIRNWSISCKHVSYICQTLNTVLYPDTIIHINFMQDNFFTVFLKHNSSLCQSSIIILLKISLGDWEQSSLSLVQMFQIVPLKQNKKKLFSFTSRGGKKNIWTKIPPNEEATWYRNSV